MVMKTKPDSNKFPNFPPHAEIVQFNASVLSFVNRERVYKLRRGIKAEEVGGSGGDRGNG